MRISSYARADGSFLDLTLVPICSKPECSLTSVSFVNVSWVQVALRSYTRAHSTTTHAYTGIKTSRSVCVSGLSLTRLFAGTLVSALYHWISSYGLTKYFSREGEESVHDLPVKFMSCTRRGINRNLFSFCVLGACGCVCVCMSTCGAYLWLPVLQSVSCASYWSV